MVRHGTFTLVFLRLIVEHHNLIVVTGSDDFSGHHIEAPDFTFEVRLHDDPLLGRIGREGFIEFKNRTIAEADQKVAVEHIQRARERRRDVDELEELKSAV